MTTGEVRIGSIAMTNGSWKWTHGQCGRVVVYRVLDGEKASKYQNPARQNLIGTAVIWQSRKVDFGTAKRPGIALQKAKNIVEAYVQTHPECKAIIT